MKASHVRTIVRWLRRSYSGTFDMTVRKLFLWSYQRRTGKNETPLQIDMEMEEFEKKDVIPWHCVLEIHETVYPLLVARTKVLLLPAPQERRDETQG